MLRFLKEDGIEPTNNRAERDLRPAVIARKVSQCPKNERGARAFEAIASVLHTIRKTDPAGIVVAFTKLFGRQPAPPDSTACLALRNTCFSPHRTSAKLCLRTAMASR